MPARRAPVRQRLCRPASGTGGSASRAAAGLHHTNIVPVFGVGEHDGLHYFVMQFIPGRSLGDVIAELAGKEHPGAPSSAAAAEPCNDAAPAIGDATVPCGRRYWRWV